MRRRTSLFALVPVLLAVGLASAQESYPLMERFPSLPSTYGRIRISQRTALRCGLALYACTITHDTRIRHGNPSR